MEHAYIRGFANLYKSLTPQGVSVTNPKLIGSEEYVMDPGHVYSPKCLEYEFSEVQGSNLPAYPHPHTNRDGGEPYFSPLSHP
jgi:hypothetical protein